MRGLSLLAVLEGGADPGRAQVVPGGLDEQPAGVAGAALGDRTLPPALAGLVERGYEAEPGDELRRPREAGEVADLRCEHERGQRVDPTEAARAGEGRPPLALEREPGEALVERGFAGDQPVDGGERVQVGELGRRFLEALTGEPLAVPLRPGARLRVDASVQEQQLRNAVPAAHQVGADLLAGAAEVTSRLEVGARHADELQLTCKQEAGEQLGVLTIGLDPIARRPRRLARRHHLDAHAGGLGRPVEREPGRSGLITGAQRLRQRLQPGDHLPVANAKAGASELARPNVDRGGVPRAGMDIQARECHRCGHGLTLPSVTWGQPEPVSGQTNPRSVTRRIRPPPRSRLLSRHRV